MADELVERDAKGEYSMCAPQTTYKHLAMGLGHEVDEETGIDTDSTYAYGSANDFPEHENQLIDMYGKPNAHWDAVAVEEEIKAALKSSRRKLVASIEDDRWMFEGGSTSSGKN
jgi:hypothetical protein